MRVPPSMQSRALAFRNGFRDGAHQFGRMVTEDADYHRAYDEGEDAYLRASSRFLGELVGVGEGRPSAAARTVPLPFGEDPK